MLRVRNFAAVALASACALVGCKDDETAAADTAGASTGDAPASTGAAGSDDGSGSGTGGAPADTAVVTHSWGSYDLAPLQEVEPCMQWTLHNEKPIYVNAVTLANDGGFHHSNWLIVPEAKFEGEDGFFNCADRGYTELDAAVSGGVLTAQSTQSRYEKMQLPTGVVVKIPPNYKIIAGAHLLNLAASELSSEFRMSLDLIHPKDVEVVTAAFRLSYGDLDIPALTESRFSGHCDMAATYEDAAGVPLDLKLYYVLPHYHYLGNFFDLTVLGGPQDGESVFRLDGFNADANGAAFDPPVDLTGANGFSFTCGFNNWRDVDIGWGIGDQEMCVMLGLADSAVLMDAGVTNGSMIVGTDGSIQLNEGPCGVVGLPKNPEQGPPTPEEIDGELYVPPTDPADDGLAPFDDCVDTPADASPIVEPTLTNVRDTLFVSSCTFSACHGVGNPAAGLDLTAADLHTVLTTKEVVGANTSMPLVAPGDPDGSWLYQKISKCEPTDDGGAVATHMPLNAPELADPGMVALVRDWIAAGAMDN